MEIQMNGDRHIHRSDTLYRKYREMLQKTLHRFGEHLTNVVIFVGDENGSKTGTADKKCTIEARLRNRPAEAVTHYAETLDHAFAGALEKLKRLLDSRIGKLQKH